MHSELENEKEEIFSFVSQKQFRLVAVIFCSLQSNFEGIRIFVILSYESFAVPILCEVNHVLH